MPSHRRARTSGPWRPAARAAVLHAATPLGTLLLLLVVVVPLLPAGPPRAARSDAVGLLPELAEPVVRRTTTALAAEPVSRAVTIPALPARSGQGRRIVYSLSRQRVWTVGGLGRVQRTYLVSGRLSQPAPGRYRVYSKSRWTRSTVSHETMQYMVRFTHGTRTGTPIGFHSIPVDPAGHPAQRLADLGKPLSHGCIRQRLSDAAYLWKFAPVGTKVVVTR